MTEYDFDSERPTLKVSNATDSTVKAHDNRENEIAYETELKQWIETKRRSTTQANTPQQVLKLR